MPDHADVIKQQAEQGADGDAEEAF